MQFAAKVLAYEVSPVVRQQVLRAVTTAELVQHEWVNPLTGHGCIMAVAGFAAVNAKLNRKFAREERPAERIAAMLGLKPERVVEVAWAFDRLSDKGLRRLQHELRAELAKIETKASPPLRWSMRQMVEDAMTPARQLVAA